jgi:hypothetical protein
MESRKIALHETGIVAIGVAVCVGLMFGIYALIGRFSMAVLLGGLIGGLISVANFFAIAIVATLAADRAEKQDVAGGQKLISGSYPLRMLAIAGILFACAKSGFFDLIALVLPLVFVRPTITVAEFFRKKGE